VVFDQRHPDGDRWDMLQHPESQPLTRGMTSRARLTGLGMKPKSMADDSGDSTEISTSCNFSCDYEGIDGGPSPIGYNRSPKLLHERDMKHKNNLAL
jgi:hypothetical protein